MKNIVIIGNSAAGIAAASEIKEKSSGVKITIISEEIHLAYSRYKLAEFLSGELKESELVYKKKEFYEGENISLILGKKVEKVFPKKNFLLLADKTKIIYDALIIASGVSVKIAKEVKGASKHGVLGVRSIKDVKDIFELIPITRTACIWSEGIVGLKCAAALHRKGLEVKIIVSEHDFLPDMLDEKAGELLKKSFQQNGIELIFGKNIVEIFGNGDVKAIKLDSGKVIGCGIVVVDKYYAGDLKFLEDSEIVFDRTIAVDNFLRTNVENIFAAGDVAENKNNQAQLMRSFFSWINAEKQGRIAAANALLFLEEKSAQMIAYAGVSVVKASEFFNYDLVKNLI